MSGHSKWATIKHQKGANDLKRGKIFSRISKLIAIAVREGGSDDPETNPRLRLQVEKAKEVNMPKENIKRAIDKGAGRVEGASYEEVNYEGFGPNKVAMIVECVTDNRNRSNSEVKVAFDKNNGVLGSSGSTAYFFEKKGLISIKLNGKDPEEAQLELIDFGAEDFQMEEEGEMEIITDFTKVHEVSEKIKTAGYIVTDYEVIMKPNVYIDLSEEQYNKFENFLETVDDLDDVQRIFHNARKI